MSIKTLTNEEFNNFIKTSPLKSIYQTPEYAFVMNNQKYNSILLGLMDNDEIKAATLLLIKKDHGFKYAYAPRGFLIDYNDTDLLKTFIKEIKRFLNKKDIIAVKFCPLIIKSITTPKTNYKEVRNIDDIFNTLTSLNCYHLGYNNYFEALKPRFEAIVDLDMPFYFLFNDIKKEYRTKIRNAIKVGIEMFKGTKDDLKYLINDTKAKNYHNAAFINDLYEFFSKKNNIDFFYTHLDTKKYLEYSQAMYLKYEEASNNISNILIANAKKRSNKTINKKIIIDNLFNKYKAQLIEATNLLKNYPNGIITSSALIIKQASNIYLMFDGYNIKYKKFNSKHLLIWKIIEKYAKEGYKTFNLGGVSNIDIPNNKYMGLNTFKSNFNAKIYEYLGDFELVTNNALYFMYRNSSPIRKILKK